MKVKLLLNFIFHYFILLSRRKSFLIILGLLTAYINFSHSQHMTHEFFHPGSALTLSSPIIQSGMFIFGVLGVSLTLEEKRVLILTRNIHLTLRTIGKISFSLIFSIILGIIFIAIFWCFLLIKGIPISDFYYDSAIYIFYYWCLPFFIMFCIGTFFGEIFGNIFSYFCTILISILLGPLNFLTSISNIERLGISQRENNTFYHPLYGYPLETSVLLKQWIITFITLLSLALIYLFRREYQKKFLVGFIGSISILLVILFISYLKIQDIEQRLIMKTTNPEVFNEILYYEKEMNKYRELKNRNLEVKADYYDILVDTNKGNLNVLVKISFKNPLHQQLILNLYHGFKVKKVKLNNKEIQFSQKGDYIYLDSVGEGEILIKYAGQSSPLFFANNRAIFLPAYFAWIPSFNMTPIFSFYDNQLHRNFAQNNYTADYTLTYKGPLRVFSNLETVSSNRFKGKSSNGVTLIAGALSFKETPKEKIVFPNTWYKGLKEYSKFKDLMSTYINATSSILNKHYSAPKNIFIIPITGMNDTLVEENFWIFNDHWIISFPLYQSFNEGVLIKKDYLINSLIPALAWKNNAVYNANLKKQELFNAALSTWIASKFGVNNTDYFNFILDKYSLYYPNEKPIIDCVNILRQIRFEKVKNPSYFYDWYKAIEKNQNWQEINEILRGFQHDQNKKFD
jgi:hypothetical protein